MDQNPFGKLTSKTFGSPRTSLDIGSDVKLGPGATSGRSGVGVANVLEAGNITGAGSARSASMIIIFVTTRALLGLVKVASSTTLLSSSLT